MFRLLKETMFNIKNGFGTFISSLIALIIVFLMVDFVLIFLYNMNNYKSAIGNSNQIIIYTNPLERPEQEQFQLKLLGTKGIGTVKYESKEFALSNLEKELGYRIDNEENPLSDAYYVYVSNDENTNLDELETTLTSYTEIESIDFRKESIQNVKNFQTSITNFLKLSMLALVIIAFILIYNVTATSIKIRKNEIKTLNDIGVTPSSIWGTYLVENIIIVIISCIIGYILFLIFYNMIVPMLSTSNNSLVQSISYSSGLKILFISIIFGLIIVLIASIMNSFKYFKMVKR